MKTWIKRSLLGVVGSLIVLLGVSGCSSYRGSGPMNEAKSSEFRAKMVERVGKRLDLTAVQKQKLVVLGEKMNEQRTALMTSTTLGSATDPRAEFQAVIAGSTLDKARAQKLVDDKTAALKGKSPEVIASAADFFDSLNPEQQQKVRDFMSQRSRWNKD